jgi:hypothetical protein
MQSGQRVYGEINQRIEAARGQAAAHARELQALTAELDRSRAGESAQTKELARLRLDLLAANEVASGLDAADQRALALLKQRGEAFARLHHDIEASVAAQQQLADARSEALAERDRQLQLVDATAADARRALAADPAFRAAQAAAESAQQRARFADEKAGVAEQDRSAKRLPYESDKLFVYLWERRFAFPEYEAPPLIRTLDGWVARLIGYEAAHRNYRMLLALADRMREHAERQKSEAAAAVAALAAMDAQALERAGLPALAAALDRAEAAQAEAEKKLEAEEARHQQLLEARAAIAAGTDAYTGEAMKTLETQLGREDLGTLRRDAQATASAKDDALVAKLANLRAEAGTLARRVAEMQAAQQQTLRQLAEMEELRTRFRHSTYDSRDSEFEDGLAVGAVLDSLLRGAIVLNDAWGSIHRNHRFRIPRGHRGGGSGNVFGGWGGGSSGGGGFGSGGGFKSGGGFGGGGFKTGGGF